MVCGRVQISLRLELPRNGKFARTMLLRQLIIAILSDQAGFPKKNALHHTFEHWYRIIQHRFRNKEFQESEVQTPQSSEDMAEALAARRARTFSSSVAAHWVEWRANCTRQRSHFVPNQISNDEQINEDSIDSQREFIEQFGVS